MLIIVGGKENMSDKLVSYKNAVNAMENIKSKKIDIKGNNFLLRIAVNKWEI